MSLRDDALTRLPKAELVKMVRDYEVTVTERNGEVSDLKTKLQESLSSETGAMKRCVIALNALTVKGPAGYVNGIYCNETTMPDKDAVARVLRYLHDRFNV